MTPFASRVLSALGDVAFAAVGLCLVSALTCIILMAPTPVHRSSYLASLSLADGCLLDNSARFQGPLLVGGERVCAMDRNHIQPDELVAVLRQRLTENRQRCLDFYSDSKNWAYRLVAKIDGREIDWVCGAPGDKVRITLLQQ